MPTESYLRVHTCMISVSQLNFFLIFYTLILQSTKALEILATNFLPLKRMDGSILDKYTRASTIKPEVKMYSNWGDILMSKQLQQESHSENSDVWESEWSFWPGRKHKEKLWRGLRYKRQLICLSQLEDLPGLNSHRGTMGSDICKTPLNCKFRGINHFMLLSSHRGAPYSCPAHYWKLSPQSISRLTPLPLKLTVQTTIHYWNRWLNYCSPQDASQVQQVSTLNFLTLNSASHILYLEC